MIANNSEEYSVRLWKLFFTFQVISQLSSIDWKNIILSLNKSINTRSHGMNGKRKLLCLQFVDCRQLILFIEQLVLSQQWNRWFEPSKQWSVVCRLPTRLHSGSGFCRALSVRHPTALLNGNTDSTYKTTNYLSINKYVLYIDADVYALAWTPLK